MKITSQTPTHIGDGLTSGSPTMEPADPHEGIYLSRRSICSLGAGLSAIALFGFTALRSVAAERYDIRYVLTDQRYGQSLEFGNILCRRGSKCLEVTDGLTRLWLDALVPLWHQKGGAIAGLTLRETWVCVAEQARSRGRRSVLVGRHALAMNGSMTNHVLSAPMPVLDRAAALEKNIEPWSRVMAHLAMQCPTNMRPFSDERFQSPATDVTAPSVPLVSWIIA
jgi:hypothetical protein